MGCGAGYSLLSYDVQLFIDYDLFQVNVKFSLYQEYLSLVSLKTSSDYFIKV